MTNWSRSRFVLIIISIVTIGIALRSLPLYQSPLPFNPDGIIHARNAEIAAETGQLPLHLSSVNTDDLGFGSFLAVLQLLTGIESLYLGQPVIAFIGTLPAFLAAVVSRRMGLNIGWSLERARLAGIIGGLFLAVEGLYLFRSMPVDEQTPGLFLVPLVLVAIVIGLWQSDRRWILAAIPLLLYLPSLHNLESVITGLSLTALFSLAVIQSTRRRAMTLAAFGLTVLFWAYFAIYNIGLTRFTATQVIQTDRLLTAPGLLMAWVIIAILGIAWFSRASARTQRSLLLTPFLALFGLMSVNFLVPVVPGLPETPLTFLLPTLALLLPVAIGCWGYPIVSTNPQNQSLIVILLAGPLTLIGFTMTAALTPVYFQTGSRTMWFLHLPTAILVAVTTVTLFQTQLLDGPTKRAIFTVVLVLSIIVSIPISFAGLSIVSYKGVTTPGEFATSSFAHNHVPGTWTSDDHLVRISRYYPPNGSGTVAPVYSWVHNASTPPPDCPIAIKESWTSVGAQFYPRPPATISQPRLERLDWIYHRIYDGGSAQRLRIYHPPGESAPKTC